MDEHIPVLAETLAERISLSKDAVIIDATVGHGGHSLLFGERLGPEAAIIGLDVDRDCIRRAQENLSDLQCKVIIVRANFSHIASVIAEAGIDKVDFILADLGFCSAQLTDSSRGLSFQENMPLDMRLDDRITTTAADIVNRTDEKALADLIYNFGQDRASRRIARFIAAYRRDLPITTTGQLAALVCRALNQPAKGRRSRIHPATRTFQALRIAVNDELGNIEKLLATAPEILKKGGQIAVISFHSLEDRIVKNDFKQKRLEGLYEVITKKPLTASDSETADNPRARSAKLRIAKRL
jgi:16S rRNA (cytosine1402-N4)-methyltransferase